MPLFDDSRWKPGDPLLAERLNKLQDALKRLEKVRGGAGVAVRQTSGGLEITGVAEINRCLAVASGAITARSGTSAGSGQVDRQYIDSTGAIASTGEELLAVLNPSSSTMTSGNGIDDGQYCWVEKDAYGVWIVSPLECS